MLMSLLQLAPNARAFTRLAWLTISFALNIGAAPASAKVLFLAHLDGSTANADYALGQREARPVPANAYTLAGTADHGRWGPALDLTHGDANCIFDAERNFNSRRGTVDFWFRIDQHEKGMYHPLFGWYRPPAQPDNRTRQSAFEVYFKDSMMTLGLHTPEYEGHSQAARFEVGRWHHLEINWDCVRGDGQSAYNVWLDGKNVIHVKDAGALRGQGGELHLGVWDYAWGHFLRGRIDELRITDQVEHQGGFDPPARPYALPGTIQYAKDTYQVAVRRLELLDSEIESMMEFSGSEGRAIAAHVLREGQATVGQVERSLISLQSLLEADNPEVKILCTAVDTAVSRINTARTAIGRTDAAAIAAKEDKRSLLFKDLDDEMTGSALILKGKQLFIDDHIIEEMRGSRKVLHQPVKHARNPLIVADRPWERTLLNRGSVLYDDQDELFKMWYIVYTADLKEQLLCFATSIDGLDWKKPIINKDDQTNIIPNLRAANPPNVFKDKHEADPARRYKMLYGAGTSGDYSTHVAYSPDGIRWTPEPANPVIPHSDTLNACVWDDERKRYVAYVRYGPPNTRAITRIESRDFVHWSPKVTVLRRDKIDQPFETKHYGMRVMSYETTYLGFISAYHGETISPIPDDQLWRDRTNVQMAFSRNGITWHRIGQDGVISSRHDQDEGRDWKQTAERATFIPYGKSRENDWDWGQVYPFQPPLIVGDQIRFYYQGLKGRHWFNYHKDPLDSGFGLATLRLDGFVSVTAEAEGTLLTRRFICIGDTLVLNAATGDRGSIRVEAIDALGRVIKGFSEADCEPIVGDKVRHVVSWKRGSNCHPLQARPMRLRFHLKQAEVYSFEFQIRHSHYVPTSYSQE